MKTKFSQILKLKKQKVEEIENELMDVRFKKQKTLSEIDTIMLEISELKMPKTGNFSQMNISFGYLSSLSNQKKAKEQEIVQLDLQIEGIKELYKEANIEFEKVHYLEDLEIKKHLKELKIKENKDMDEIANLLHSRAKIEVEV